MNPAALFFWGLAAVKVYLSLKVQLAAARRPVQENLRFSKSQRSDDWLALATMFVAARFDTELAGWLHIEIRDLSISTGSNLNAFSFSVYLLCTLVTGWLIRRAGLRLHLMQKRK